MRVQAGHRHIGERMSTTAAAPDTGTSGSLVGSRALRAPLGRPGSSSDTAPHLHEKVSDPVEDIPDVDGAAARADSDTEMGFIGSLEPSAHDVIF